jgi:hypothetical protein
MICPLKLVNPVLSTRARVYYSPLGELPTTFVPSKRTFVELFVKEKFFSNGSGSN